MIKFSNQLFFQNIILIILIVFTIGTAKAHEEPAQEFVHGITIQLDHQNYYLAGPPDGINGASDLPGHEWVRTGKTRLLGKQYNRGPFGSPSFWSSDAGDGALLYIMDAVVDEWSELNALQFFTKGFTFYTTLVNAESGEPHPTKVLWLKHVAIKSFTLDGASPLAFLGIDAYTVMPGVDYKMGSNWNIPYNSDSTQ